MKEHLLIQMFFSDSCGVKKRCRTRFPLTVDFGGIRTPLLVRKRTWAGIDGGTETRGEIATENVFGMRERKTL